MDVLIYGSADRLERLGGHPVLGLSPTLRTHDEPLPEFLGGYELIIDLNFDHYSELAERLSEFPKAILLVSAVEHSLLETLRGASPGASLEQLRERCFGLNALPGFIELPSWEVSLLLGQPAEAARARLSALPFPCQFVQDQVGMVSPRVICRIINEAYLLLEEGLASREDIDRAMQLGVNYPRGPFAWAEHIGLETVWRVLRRLSEAYGAEAYRVSRLLEHEAHLTR